MSSWDVIVLGANPDALAAAGSLARRRKRVLVLERGEQAGGLAGGRQLAPGCLTRGVLQDTSQVSPKLIRRLGLETVDPPPVLGLQSDGPGLLLHRSPTAARDEVALHSARDAAGYAEWRAWLKATLPPLRRLMQKAPFDIGLEAPLWPLFRAGAGIRGLGKDAMGELLRRAPGSALDLVSEFVETPLLQAMLLAPGLRGTWMGPRSPTSAAALLLHEAQAGRELLGGPQILVGALLADCGARGVEIRLAQEISGLEVESGRVVGVVAGGELLRSTAVLSCLGPRHTLLELVPPRGLRGAVVREIGNIRCRGTLAAVSFALSARPRFRCRPDQVVSVAQWAETPEHQEKAWDDAKHRRFPRRPTLDIRIHEDEGGWVLQVLLRSAAFDLEGGWSSARRSELRAMVTSQLGELVCEFENTMVASEVLTPVDLAEKYGLDGGHELQAEVALDQLHAFRPSRSLARYRAPVAGLWLGSSGAHPGGGVSGTAGLLAAAALLRP